MRKAASQFVVTLMIITLLRVFSSVRNLTEKRPANLVFCLQAQVGRGETPQLYYRAIIHRIRVSNHSSRLSLSVAALAYI